jgi:hypothetical protein
MSDEMILYVLLGLMIVAGVAFSISIFFQSKKNVKWLAFTAFGFFLLNLSGLMVLKISAMNLSRDSTRNLLIGLWVFLGMSSFFYLAYQFQRDKS